MVQLATSGHAEQAGEGALIVCEQEIAWSKRSAYCPWWQPPHDRTASLWHTHRSGSHPPQSGYMPACKPGGCTDATAGGMSQ
jgi:hypothetical protein